MPRRRMVCLRYADLGPESLYAISVRETYVSISYYNEANDFNLLKQHWQLGSQAETNG